MSKEGQQRWEEEFGTQVLVGAAGGLSLEERRLRGDLVTVHRSLTGWCSQDEPGSAPRQPVTEQKDRVFSNITDSVILGNRDLFK